VQIYQKKLFLNEDCDIVYIAVNRRSNF
jgi:hypothetical protein